MKYQTIEDVEDQVLDKFVAIVYKMVKAATSVYATPIECVTKFRDYVVNEAELSLEEKKALVTSLFLFLDTNTSHLQPELVHIKQIQGQIGTLDYQTLLAPLNGTNKINVTKYLIRIQQYREDPEKKHANDTKLNVIDIFKKNNADEDLLQIVEEVTEDAIELTKTGDMTNIVQKMMTSKKNKDIANKMLKNIKSKKDLNKIGKVLLDSANEVMENADPSVAMYLPIVKEGSAQLKKLLDS